MVGGGRRRAGLSWVWYSTLTSSTCFPTVLHLIFFNCHSHNLVISTFSIVLGAWRRSSGKPSWGRTRRALATPGTELAASGTEAAHAAWTGFFWYFVDHVYLFDSLGYFVFAQNRRLSAVTARSWGWWPGCGTTCSPSPTRSSNGVSRSFASWTWLR